MNSLISKRIVPTLQQSVRRLVATAPDAPRPASLPDSGKCLNKVMLMGRCTSDARFLPLGENHFASFTLVTNNYRRTKQNEIVRRSDFHRVVVYRPFLAKRCSDLISKGTRIYIEGQLNYRKTENNVFVNILADTVIFLSGTNQNIDSMEEMHANNEDIVPEDFDNLAVEAEQK